MPAQVVLGTPEWEREDWQGVSESQTSPDGYYNHMARTGRGIVRRGSGGGGSASRARPPSASGRAVSLGMQGVTTGVGLPADPYAHTKKTRTKPIRNADGILIRKDGRPDMRSQSSAANLRKVHARKEDPDRKDSEQPYTPTSGLHHSASMGTETPSPTNYLPAGHDLTNSVQKKHNAIMGKMFPGGIDESRKDHDYASKVFDEGQDHTAHPRSQHHHHSHHQPVQPVFRPNVEEGRPLHIKKEQVERTLGSQSPDDGDVDMDRAEHADDEGQTPSERSENSAQYHDANTSNHQECTVPAPTQAQAPTENGTQGSAPMSMPTATAESIQTVQAEATLQAA